MSVAAAILAAIAKSTGKGMQGAGRYLQGTSSAPSNDNDKDKEEGLIEKVDNKIQEAKAKKEANRAKLAGDVVESNSESVLGQGSVTGASGTEAGVGGAGGMSVGGTSAAGASGTVGMSAGASGAAGAGSAGAGAAGASAGAAGAAGAGAAAAAASDERLKRVCGDNADLINLFSKIGSYEFNYNDKAKALNPNGENHVDNKRHVGVMAQELEKNPATNAVINTDKRGYKTVDTAQLTLTNTAVLADVCRRLEALENQLGI